MRRLDRAFDRLASRGRRSDPEVVIDRLERRLTGEPGVVRIPGGPGMERFQSNVTRRRALANRGRRSGGGAPDRGPPLVPLARG